MSDDFFSEDTDQFEDIVSSFFGQPMRRRTQRNTNTNKNEDEPELGFIETDDITYLIVELPGFSEKDIEIDIKARKIEISAQKKSLTNVKEYLAPRLQTGIKIVRTLPNDIDSKKFSHSFKNGVLEVAFKRT